MFRDDRMTDTVLEAIASTRLFNHTIEPAKVLTSARSQQNTLPTHSQEVMALLMGM
jgi:hypothetical protein